MKHKNTIKKTNVKDASTSLRSNIQATIKRQNERCWEKEMKNEKMRNAKIWN
jgi:hypothetical protein